MIEAERVEMEHLALHVHVHHDEGSYWAEVRELPGCFASGHTIAELIKAELNKRHDLFIAELPCLKSILHPS